MKNRIAVIGIGTGGIQTIAHFLSWLADWEVVSIHDPKIPIVGIGESTNPSFVVAMETGAHLNMYDDIDELDATYKFGTVYKQWRDRDFINPLISGAVALHVNTFKLKDFALPRFRSIWGDKFREIEGTVEEVIGGVDKATVQIDGVDHYFDLVVDCRGFPKDYSDYHVIDGWPVNRCLVHNKKLKGDWQYTGHRATQDGWMFEIPLQSRQSYGYLFNDTITDEATAKQNFAKEIDVPVEELDNISYSFKAYYIKECMKNRVIKNGNSAVFFEPMFANSLWMYDSINRLLCDVIEYKNKHHSFTYPQLEESMNRNLTTNTFIQVEELICFHYAQGSKYDTPFWKYAKEFGANRLKTSSNFEATRKVFEEEEAEKVYKLHQWVFNTFSLRRMFKNFGFKFLK